MSRAAAALGLLLAAGQAHVASGFVTSLTSPVAAASVQVGDPGTATLEMMSLASVDPLAVCNDGSPAAYFFAPGTGSGANIWLVYLEGSMFCFNQDSCNTRYKSKPFWMSSTSWAPQFAQGGIFSDDESESPFYNANLIYVKYCSSDLWSGDVGASNATFGYDFRGFRIITATITALIENHGMGSTPGSRLLFGGCSAGAIGAMNAIDVVAQMTPPGLQVQGLLDAAALVDIDPADNGFSWAGQLQTLQSLVADVMGVVNPQLPTSCLDMYPGESWKCMWGQYRLPLVKTPYFANAPQFDSFEIGYDDDNYVPSTPQQLAFVDSFQPAILSLISNMPAGTSVYSSTCFVHCLSEQTTFYNLETAGTTMMQAVNTWFFEGQEVRVISSCQGWQCTDQCGLDTRGMPCNMGTSGCTLYPGYTESASAPRGANQPGYTGGGGQQQQQQQQAPQPQQAPQQQNNNNNNQQNNNNNQQNNNNNNQQPQQQQSQSFMAMPSDMPAESAPGPTMGASADAPSAAVSATESSLAPAQKKSFFDFMSHQENTQSTARGRPVAACHGEARRRLRSTPGCCGVDIDLLKEGQKK